MPIPSLQLQEKPVLCREAEGLVTELWSPRFVTMQCLCSQLCYVTAANQRTLVEIELLATVSWKWGCQPFSCRCSQNVTHCRKEICSTCLSKESIPMPRFFLRAALPCSWLHHALHDTSCIHAHPFVVTAEKAAVLCREVGLPAFQLPMFPKCDALPKRD